jgi:alkanesulfonate monooxygenase SsuD/methylene tetrahydromethanopterin reductase-like flavin-dependent oxidoreductase (luciferase family)
VTVDLSRFGFGIVGHTPTKIVQELAPLVEQAGFATLWFNHTAQGNAFAAMEAAARVTTTLRLATGVTSLDGVMSAADIVQQVTSRHLPLDRLTLGIGANRPPTPIRIVREGFECIRDHMPAIPVYVGALGPQMRAFGVRHTDGILLNWLTPKAAAMAMEERHRDAPASSATVALYIRCALGEAGATALSAEAARYEAFPSYAANFERLGFRAMDAAVQATTPAELQTRLNAFIDVVDEPILRAIVAEETTAAYASLVDAARN